MNKAVAGDAQVKSSNSNTAVNVMHKSSAALAVLVPGSLAAAGTAAAIPVDVTMSLFLTGHTVFGLQGIVEDYVPKAMQGGVNVLAAVAGGAAFAGLVGLSVYGNGVGGTMEQLWSEKAEKKSE